MPGHNGGSLRETLLIPLQLIKRASIEWIVAVTFSSFLLSSVYGPTVVKEKVQDAHRPTLGNWSEEATESFVAKEVATIAQFRDLIRHPLEWILGPLIGEKDPSSRRYRVALLYRMFHTFNSVPPIQSSL